MNEYGFNYMNYITNLPSNMMDMNNKFNTDNMNKNSSVMNKFNFYSTKNKLDKEKPVEPYLGFIRGNLFDNLYNPYKNYKPEEIEAKDEREALLYQVMQYKFALIELNLYLDTNPNDKEAIELFNQYQKIEKQMCNQYESMYGPLTLDSNYLNNDNWVWNNSPWPWEVM